MYQAKTTYGIECYSAYNDYPVAMSTVDEFNIDILLSEPNPNLKNFSFIAISKHTEIENTITIEPLLVIYDKNIWKINYRLKKYWLGLTNLGIKTNCSCPHHSLDYFGKLQKFPCHNQEELIRKYNIIAEKLKYKGKYRTLIRKPR